MSTVNCEVLASRPYSFQGDKGDTVNLVEATIRVNLDGATTIGKISFKGTQALVVGMYTASIKAAEKAGKLVFNITDLRLTKA